MSPAMPLPGDPGAEPADAQKPPQSAPPAPGLGRLIDAIRPNGTARVTIGGVAGAECPAPVVHAAQGTR